MIVLSLFDGMGCGLEALKRAGVPVTKYYASEIDKYTIQIAKKNHPEIIHLGDVQDWENWNIETPDLIIGGSPCQGFSFAGKKLAFNDPRSKLFFTMTDIIEYYKPKYKFLENVRMKKEHLEVITEYMGVEPVMINSSLVSAQNRVRYYWFNWEAKEPEDKEILLRDIVHENCLVDREKSHAIISSIGRTTKREYFKKSQGQMVYEVDKFDQSNCLTVDDYDKYSDRCKFQIEKNKVNLDGKSLALTTNSNKTGSGVSILNIPLSEYIVPFDKTLQILDKEVERGKVGYFRKDSQANRVYYIHGKSVTLCGDAGGGAAKMGQYLFGCITPDRVEKRQNGQRFNDGNKFYTLTAQDKHGILIEGYIRKLTPVECERLQTLHDGYTEGVSNSQRYKMLGNGWTVEVIAGLFEQGLK